MKTKIRMTILLSCIFLTGFSQVSEKSEKISPQDSILYEKIREFAIVKLKTDLSSLTDKEKQMIPHLISAAKITDEIYWEQSVQDKEAFFSKLKSPAAIKFAEINYGPWERLNANFPFAEGFWKRPLGLYFYPSEMSKEEFAKWNNPLKESQYSIVSRNDDGTLKIEMYSEKYREKLSMISQYLLLAAGLAEEPGLKNYLQLRSREITSDGFQKSDMAWMDMKNNTIDIVIGPIENYDDDRYGIRTSYEAVVLVKDLGWSKKLAKFASFLPELQSSLPVEEKYKSEKPGTDSDLNAYDVIYVAGQANAGSKTIAINLPNDEEVQLQKGSRRLQLKNVMKAKFDKILVPISSVMIEKSQRDLVVFDAFFSNVMFHEVAHGLGIKNTVNGKGTVREALKEQYSSFEEAKADILGLYMVTKLIEKGEIAGLTKEQCYVTYMAGLIRSVRFGAASSHGKANMMCFNYFEAAKAFERTKEGVYKVNFEKFTEAMNGWTTKVLVFQGNGDYKGTSEYLAANGRIGDELQGDLQRLKKARIPVDIVYEQGLDVLGLSASGKELSQPGSDGKGNDQDKKKASPQAPPQPRKPAPTPVR